MKNLYDKLDKEVIKKLEDDKEHFRALVDSIEENLRKTFFIDDLRFGDVQHLFTYMYGSLTPFNILKFYNLFED